MVFQQRRKDLNPVGRGWNPPALPGAHRRKKVTANLVFRQSLNFGLGAMATLAVAMPKLFMTRCLLLIMLTQA